jgi:uncharacterized protein YecE (DUF72 family)
VGTSGWIYQHWRGVFYPERLPAGKCFAYYAARFDTVEINYTFYHLPDRPTFDGWRLQAPQDFCYALKASRFLTHRKKLNEPEQPLALLLERARRLGSRLGPILYQLPPRWKCNLERLRQFVNLLPQDLLHAFEFRDPSWYNDEVRALLDQAGMGFCIHDMAGSPSPLWVTGRLAYVRFHGAAGAKYEGLYTQDQMRAWAQRLGQYLKEGRDTYAYFNNDGGGHALVNARQLRELLTA